MTRHGPATCLALPRLGLRLSLLLIQRTVRLRCSPHGPMGYPAGSNASASGGCCSLPLQVVTLDITAVYNIYRTEQLGVGDTSYFEAWPCSGGTSAATQGALAAHF